LIKKDFALNTSPNYEKRWYVLGVMCIVLFIISIDNTVLNLALPSISRGLNASASQLQWIVDAYTLIFASLLITTGAVGDRYGRKRLLMIGLTLFGFGSLGAALSTTTEILIAFRALLGLAGAMIMPSTLSILIDVFRDGRERAKAIAIWSSIFSIGAGIGPIVGGFLINLFEWSSVFYLNLPIVVIGLLGVYFFAPESRDVRAPKPDLPGVLLSITGLLALVYGMIQAGESGWTAQIVLLAFALSVVLLAAFIWWENHSPAPMLPLEFFKNMSFTGANTALTICAFAMMGSMYFFSQFFQSVQGYSPLISSIYMFPMTPFVFASTMYSVRVDHRFGPRFTMSIGLLSLGIGLFAFSCLAAVDTPYWQVFLILATMGCGIGFTMSPATNAVMNSLPPNRAGIGSAMNDTTRQLGGALGVAVLGALMNGAYRNAVTHLKTVPGVSAGMLDAILGSIQSAHIVAQKTSADLAAVIVQTSNQAYVDGMREALLIGSIVMFVAAVAARLLLPEKVVVKEMERPEGAVED
jgi:EmrB/QacA subfamily drug resistance transporter